MKKYILHDPSGNVESHIDFKGNLNPEQYEVVTAAEGPCLVLAGAGSGKTRTLIYRLAYLLERKVDPRNILLMTFTNKAAREMRNRTEMLLKYEPKGLWSGTFHHIGNRTLRMYAEHIGFGRDFGILDQDDSKDLIKACMKAIGTKAKEEKFPKPSVVQSIISLSLNTGKTIKKVLEQRYSYFERFAGEIEGIMALYEKKKKSSNNMDYDDLLIKWRQLLETVPSARERFTNQFRYIMVDEYQDTNILQASIIDILGEKYRNLLVVGDDAQSIYSFRGARVDNILEFPSRYKDAKVYKLEINYRSTPEILELANDSLLNNTRQFEKTLKAVNPSLEKPVLVEAKDLYAQASFLAQRVLEMREEGVEMRDMAVLFRAHYQSAELEMELVKRGIPYIVRGGIRFFEQAHIKDVLAYLKMVANPLDEIAWMRTLTMCPGIGPGYAEKIYSHFMSSGRDIMAFVRSEDISRVVPPKAVKGYEKFRRIMKVATDPATLAIAPGELIDKVLSSGYEDHLMTNFENAKDRLDDIHELINFSHEYSELKDFLNDMTLRESFRGETVLGAKEEDEHLVLSTVHQAKGLEWDAVFIIGLCEGQFPHPKAMQEDPEMEEERRLFYVAVTRARKYLYLLHPVTRYDHQMGTVISRHSRFLEELSPGEYEVWEVETALTGFNDDPGDEMSYGAGAEMDIIDL
ncbi:MAG: UvrD-helicase domain-containing protein [Candidatus Omnitrophica bacterium]|nr:UvrD-helicase domain-containing protein [Candidatus Omnitrophota bacterium]MDD5488420.1 UvrD-helicase domain-containing protein [Candidatus Omnitrophota bacterium]